MMSLVDGYSSGEEDNDDNQSNDDDPLISTVEESNGSDSNVRPTSEIIPHLSIPTLSKKKKGKKRKKRKKKSKSKQQKGDTKAVLKKLGIQVSDLMEGKSYSTKSLISNSKNLEPENPEFTIEEDLEKTLKVLPSKRKRLDNSSSSYSPPTKKLKLLNSEIGENSIISPEIPSSILKLSKEQDLKEKKLRVSIEEYLNLSEEHRKTYDEHYSKSRPKDFETFKQKVYEYEYEKTQLSKPLVSSSSENIFLAPYPISEDINENQKAVVNNELDKTFRVPENLKVVDLTKQRDHLREQYKKKEQMERFRREIYNPNRFKVLDQQSRVGGLKNQLVSMAKDAAKKELDYNDIRNSGGRSKSKSWGTYGF